MRARRAWVRRAKYAFGGVLCLFLIGMRVEMEGESVGRSPVLKASKFVGNSRSYPLFGVKRSQDLNKGEWNLKLGVFNMLCPSYKRLPENRRESHDPELYRERVADTISLLSTQKADINCLQEFWVENQDVQQMFADALQDKLRGHTIVELKRTSHWAPRDDGLAFLLGPRVKILDAQEILFQDCGDRVAFLLLTLVDGKPVITVNTHLLFPHCGYSSDIRCREVRKILMFVNDYRKSENIEDVPVIICGDFNGSPYGTVAEYMRNQGFQFCSGMTGREEDENLGNLEREVSKNCYPWVTHKTHRGNTILCDHVWMLNPSRNALFEPEDWKDRVFTEISAAIVQQNLTLPDSFKKFFDQDSNDLVDGEEFRAALKSLGFHGEGKPHLLDIEIDALMSSADVDQDGRIDYKEFIDRFWKATQDPDLMIGISSIPAASLNSTDADIKFLRGIDTAKILQEGVLAEIQKDKEEREQLDSWDLKLIGSHVYPSELEEGNWPDSWNLSDHGFVTTTFRQKSSHSSRQALQQATQVSANLQ